MPSLQYIDINRSDSVGPSGLDLNDIALILQKLPQCPAALSGAKYRNVSLAGFQKLLGRVEMIKMTMRHEDRIIPDQFLRIGSVGASLQFQKRIEQNLVLSALKSEARCAIPCKLHILTCLFPVLPRLYLASFKSACVYGCSGCRKTFCVSPYSTIYPCCMTITLLQICQITFKS